MTIAISWVVYRTHSLIIAQRYGRKNIRRTRRQRPKLTRIVIDIAGTPIFFIPFVLTMFNLNLQQHTRKVSSPHRDFDNDIVGTRPNSTKRSRKGSSSRKMSAQGPRIVGGGGLRP